MLVNRINSATNFTALKPIPQKAFKIGGAPLKEALPTLEILAKDVDIEVIPKKGFLTKIQSLVFFVTKPNQKKGTWISLSKDPNKFLSNDNYRYITTRNFSGEKIVKAVEKAKSRLLKYDSKLSRPSMPADMAILSDILPETGSCSIE